MNKVILTFFIFCLNQTLQAQCLDGDCYNGFGKFSCECGYVYEGDFVKGEKVNGKLTKDDLVYTGEFKHDVAHGKGLIQYKDGSWFKGDFVENYPEGYGIYYFSDGQKYIGEFVQGIFSGLGIQYVKDKDDEIIETQIGEFDNDVLHGYGCAISTNGDIYLGHYEDGNYSGFGYYFFKEDGMAEAGEYKKKKLYENGILLDYPKQGMFGVEDYSIGKYSYDVVSDTEGEKIYVQEDEKTERHRIFILDNQQQMFFLSKKGDPENGTIIKFSGDIFEGSLSPENSSEIIIGDCLFVVE